MKQPQKRRLDSGMGAVGIITCLGFAAVISILAKTLYSKSADAMLAQRSEELRADLENIRRVIAASVDCDATLAVAGIDTDAAGGGCDTSSVANGQGTGPFFGLRRKTVDGSADKWLTGPSLAADGSGKIGAWRIRASCSRSEQSLVIRASRVNASGTTLKDPLNKSKSQGWYDKGSLLFGSGSGAESICFSARGRFVRSSAGRVLHGQTINPVPGFSRRSCKLLVGPEDHHYGTNRGNGWGEWGSWGDNHYGGGRAYYNPATWTVSCQYGLYFWNTQPGSPAWQDGSCNYLMVCSK